MAIHNALISGSFAIQFFEGLKWTESDLDIFVESGPGVTKLRQYLFEVEGYCTADLEGRENEVYLTLSGIAEVRQLEYTYPNHRSIADFNTGRNLDKEETRFNGS